MKKILYITANTKPEDQSSSKTVGRRVVDALQGSGNAFVEELDLYRVAMPQLKHEYFTGRNTLVGPDVVAGLAPEDRQAVDEIAALCDDFVNADVVVLAAPMWSLSFPSVVKQYLDHIIISGKTITFTDDKPVGLLSDRPRAFVYVQASGMHLPAFLRPLVNKGVTYTEDMVKSMGISNFFFLPVDGTGTTPEERREAVAAATEKIETLTARISAVFA